MKLKYLKRFLNSLEDDESEVYIKLKTHYDPGCLLPFSEGKIKCIENKFKFEHLDFEFVNFIIFKDCSALDKE